MNRIASFTMFLGIFTWCVFASAIAGAEAEKPSLTEKTKPEETINTTGPLITDITIPQDPGTFTLFVPFYAMLSKQNFNSGWHRESAGKDSVSLNGSVQLFYGVFERAEIYVIVPYKHNWVSDASNPGPGGEKDANSGGIGDSNISFKYLLKQESSEFPAVSGLFGVNLPTGHHSYLNPALLGTDSLGSGAYSFILGFNLYKVITPAKLYGNIWYTMPTAATANGQELYGRDTITFNLAGEYPLSRRWIFLGEFVSTWGGGRLFGQSPNVPRQDIASVVPGIEFIAGETWNFATGIKIDVFGRNTSCGYTPAVAVFYYF